MRQQERRRKHELRSYLVLDISSQAYYDISQKEEWSIRVCDSRFAAGGGKHACFVVCIKVEGKTAIYNLESFLYSESPVMNSQRYEHSPLALQAGLALTSLVRHPFYLV